MATTVPTKDYFVGVTIGEGSFGRVVHARHKVSGKDVAIKVFEKIQLAKRPDLMLSILNERYLLQEFRSSPFVVSLWGAFCDDDCVYLVMECLKGGDLQFLIGEGLKKGSDKTLWRTTAAPHYALQLIQAVEFLHEHCTIHADLKPENVISNEQGRLQLADFGSAIRLRNVQNDSNQKQKQPCFLGGTVDYASPEVLRGTPTSAIGIAADLWSLGCIFGALLWGESPFHAESDALALDCIMNYAKSNVLPPLLTTEEGFKDVPPGWEDLIMGLLHPDPDKRHGCASGPPLKVLVPGHETIDLNKDSPFLPPKPEWIIESKRSQMTDGSRGWSPFLL